MNIDHLQTIKSYFKVLPKFICENPKFCLFRIFTKNQVSFYYGYTPNLHASSKSIRTVDQSCNHLCSQKVHFSIISENRFRLNSSFLSIKNFKVRASNSCSSRYIIENIKITHLNECIEPLHVGHQAPERGTTHGVVHVWVLGTWSAAPSASLLEVGA